MHVPALVLAMLGISSGLTAQLEFGSAATPGGSPPGVAAGSAVEAISQDEDVIPIAVSNHSFELPYINDGTFSTTAAPPGWSVYGNGINFGYRTVGVLNPTTTPLYSEPTPDGRNVGVIFLLDNPANQSYFAGIEAGLQQSLSATLQTRRRYTLRVDVGNLTSEPGALYQFLGFPNYRIDLMAGTNVLASDNNTLLPGEGRYLNSTLFVDVAASNPFAGQSLRIRLVNLNSAPGIEVNWDNVRLQSSLIPSPVLTVTHDVFPGRIRLSWFDTLGGPYVAQSAANLTEPIIWNPIFDSAALDAGTWSLSVATPDEQRFFRLQPQ